jgi:hypothetical protein
MASSDVTPTILGQPLARKGFERLLLESRSHPSFNLLFSFQGPSLARFFDKLPVEASEKK